MQKISRNPLRSLSTLAFSMVVALAALLVPATPACAQGMEAVASPLTTKRLGRLLGLYVAPTEQEAAAIDRLHEAYLARFRAELDPEISGLTKGFATGMPAKADYEKFLRDLSRLQAKIGEADNAFFNSAAELVAEQRRAGMQRVREARERQRNLSGVARMAPMMFGGGMAFVDLVDVLSRSEYLREVPEASREQFDTLLRSKEQRLLAQSRLYNAQTLGALKSVFDISIEAQEAATAAAEGVTDQAALAKVQMEQMQRMMERMREIGAEPNRIVASTVEANRQAVRQFASVLSENAYHKLRAEVARRSMGSLVRFSLGGFEEAQSVNPAAVISRLRRDPDVTADARALLDPIELSWRRDRADRTERIAELCSQIDVGKMMMGGVGGAGPDPTITAIERESVARAEDAQRAYAAIAAAVGPDKSAELFGKRNAMKPDAAGGVQEVEMIFPHQVEAVVPEPEAWHDVPAVLGVAHVNVAPRAWTARELARLYQPLGLPEASLAVLEGVVEGWRAREWDAKVVPIGTALSDATSKLYSDAADGKNQPDAAAFASIEGLRQQLVDAVFAADLALSSELQAALGLASDSAELLCLRLERAAFAASSPGFSPEGTRQVASPAAILERADVTPDVARRFFEGSREEWKAFADRLQEEAREGLDRTRRQQAAMRLAQQDASWEAYQRIVAANDAAAKAYFRAYDELCDQAAAKVGGGETGDQIKRARLALAWPEVYASVDSAIFQLDSALALEGLADAQRDRLEALMAEYEAVYHALSEKIASGAGEFDSYDPEAWRAMQERLEARQRLRFQRDEHTEKARADMRRILGDELASRVRGLVRDEYAPPKATAMQGFDPFLPEDD
jgi:hypothetical protein